MKINPKNYLAKTFSSVMLVALLTVQSFAQTAVQTKSALSATETELTEKITIASIKEATSTLSAPDMEGRGTMQRGGDKAANWIAARFQSLGLKPLGDKGSYLQKIDFKETVFTPETSLKVGEETLKVGADFGILPFSAGNKSANGEMIFIAYGIVADSIKRNDLQGVDVSGKFVVMLEGPPSYIPKKDWKAAKADRIFIQSLFMKGVAGIIFIGHGREEQTPDEMVDYFSRRQIQMPDEENGPSQMPPILYVNNNAAGKLFKASGVSLQDALAQAEKNDFKPIKLKQQAKVNIKLKSSKGTSNNVVGYLEGSDPKLKEEAVLFSAHYDAYGIENGKIYHGAADNALGTAEMLAVAEAYSKMSVKPKRSLVFVAVTGEEYGLYGSKYWAKNPTWNIKKVSANLNLDGVGTEVYGPVKTMVGYGAEHSTLGAMLEDVSTTLGIKVVGDPVPDEKVFYRSDHYSFVERGVPALMLMGAPEGDIQVSMKRMKEWEKTAYHQPADTIQENWAWEGAETVAEVMGILGWRISEMNNMPAWISTSRFAKLERGNTKELPEEN
ncbi:MAG: M20/M25/M40 family metallo-hydrolase [Pyrinomonadaceae bacterium]|nr:M20/M25/M40 family metallo-hydrolase [Pyrinomonadaceae bacterium]